MTSEIEPAAIQHVIDAEHTLEVYTLDQKMADAILFALCVYWMFT